MTINEKIREKRIKKSMSQAELAFKTGYSISDIKSYETIGTIINGFVLLRILNAFVMSVNDFEKI